MGQWLGLLHSKAGVLYDICSTNTSKLKTSDILPVVWRSAEFTKSEKSLVRLHSNKQEGVCHSTESVYFQSPVLLVNYGTVNLIAMHR